MFSEKENRGIDSMCPFRKGSNSLEFVCEDEEKEKMEKTVPSV